MKRIVAVVALLLGTQAAVFGAAPDAPSTKLIVFANRSTPVNKLSHGQLRDVLMGEVSKWSNGRPVAVLLVDNRSMSNALKRILGMSKDDYDNYFVVKRYQGQDIPRPRVFASIDGALQFLTATPGAIAVLEGEPDMTVAGAKIVRIDGKLPEEDGYRY